MTKTLTYLFDPLCGWCYGATQLVAATASLPDVIVELLPTGMFSGPGSRTMDDDFAAYAWSNDQRIERLTGQVFSQAYRDRVLSDLTQRFDSGPATLALGAVSITAKSRELDAMKTIQRARYVDGADITSIDSLATLLRSQGLDAAAERLTNADTASLQHAQQSVSRARALMREFGLRGVPAFVVTTGNQRSLANHADFYADPPAFARQLMTA